MATIVFQNVYFSYDSAARAVFEDLSLVLDTAWRTGVVGRNGRGKTTLLKLAAGSLTPQRGRVDTLGAEHGGKHSRGRCFPAVVGDASRRTREVVRNAVAPFTAWERRMESLLADGGDEALAEYGELQGRYLDLGGYGVDAAIAREFDAMGLPAELLDRPFGSLSGGEQTRALVVALFLDAAGFAFIDEPTNHLDLDGRRQLTRYLRAQRGFLLVSHDRDFLDGAVDHVLSLNAGDVRVNRGNFSQWRAHMDEELEHERRTRRRIERDVARLEAAARQTRQHASSREGDKYRTGAMDKGFIGARAARQMRRARSVERRIGAELEEKQRLLRNEEKERRLKVVTEGPAPGAPLLTVQDLTLTVNGRPLLRNLSFAVAEGERIALVGPNGCGKTCLLDALDCAVAGDAAVTGGAARVAAGTVRRHRPLAVSRGYQRPLWQRGALRDHLSRAGFDETRFRQLLGVLGVGAAVFEQPLELMSHGERKKIDLCRSLMRPADLVVWDEPLNYVDLYSREQVEAALCEDGPTLLFVEHDARFVERVATRVIRLGA